MPKVVINKPKKEKKIKEDKPKKEKKEKKVKPEKPAFKIEQGLFIVDFN
jgi:hypothetical protein